jgi:hypothetical protein
MEPPNGSPQPILARPDLLQIANARDRIGAVGEPLGAGGGSDIDPSQGRVGDCRQY